jgi:hypothetical protein
VMDRCPVQANSDATKVTKDTGVSTVRGLARAGRAPTQGVATGIATSWGPDSVYAMLSIGTTVEWAE